MTFQPLLPWAILAVVAAALAIARLFALRQVMASAGRRRMRAVLRWSGVTLAVVLLVAATTLPGLPSSENSSTTTAAGNNVNVFIVQARSLGPAAADDVNSVVDTYPAARYALITFDTEASLEWPLSDDVWSLRPTIAALSAGPQDIEVDPAAPADVLADQLTQAAQMYPGSVNVVLYQGFGVPGVTEEFGLTQGTVDGGAVVDYGSGEADGTQLRGIATQLDVPYLVRDPNQTLQLDLPEALSDAAAATARIELYWLLALVAAVLLLPEIYLSVRDFRRSRIARRDLTP